MLNWLAWKAGQRGGGGGDRRGGAEGREGLHHWMRCCYPGKVICLNALCTPGARPAAVLVFLQLGCQSEPGYLWESRPVGSSRPHRGFWTGAPAVYWGPIPLRLVETVCG